jgi:hypothetical protein
MNTETIFLILFIILVLILSIFIVKKYGKKILRELTIFKPKPNGDYAISQITDVEGNLSYFNHIINNDKLVKFDWFGNLAFKKNPYSNNHHFVITGDVIDHGVGNREIASKLLKFKKKYPNNVHLILGNRDVNKFRLIDELQDPNKIEEKDIDPVEIDRPLTLLRPANTPTTGNIFNKWLSDKKIIMEKNENGHYIGNEQNWITVLKFILDKTMNAGKSFENTKQILNLQSDFDVYKEYYYSIHGGWFYQYLKHCDIIKIINGNLFLHGAITDKFLWKIPEEGLSNPVNEKKLSSMTPDDFHQWVGALNNYYHSNLHNKNYAEIVKLGLVSVITENWVHNGNNTIIDEHTNRLLNEMNMSVFTGHKPHHDMPSTIKMDNSSYIVVISDTSYSDGAPKEEGRKALYNTMIIPNNVLIYGCKVCDNIKEEQCDYSRGCNTEDFELISKQNDSIVGKPFQDETLKVRLSMDKGKMDYTDAWWVKAIKNKNDKKTAIISKINGFNAQTKEVLL